MDSCFPAYRQAGAGMTFLEVALKFNAQHCNTAALINSLSQLLINSET